MIKLFGWKVYLGRNNLHKVSFILSR